MNQAKLLSIQCRMWSIVAVMEGMKVANEYTSRRDEAQAYPEDFFFRSADLLASLAAEADREATQGAAE